MSNIIEKLKTIHEKINSCAEAANRAPSLIQLLCVSKTKPIEKIIEAYNAGERHFGESYALEADEKIQKLKELGYKDIAWHFIGPIQKNKTKYIAKYFDMVESLDRPIIAQRLNEQRPDDLPPLEVLIQVNLSEEEQKFGCSVNEIDNLVETVKKCSKLRLKGFMGVGKDTPDLKVIEEEFIKLQGIFLKYQKTIPEISVLSIGMTHDLDLAIKHGSTEVRIGTAIFGAREYNTAPFNQEKVAFIGGGNMSSCIYESLTKIYSPEQIMVSGPHLEKLQKFKDRGSGITTDNLEALKFAEIIFLGVKPQILTSVLEEIAHSQEPLNHKLFISMAAGFKLSSIEKILNTKKIIRIMPNTPAKIGLGVVAVTYDEEVTETEKQNLNDMLKNMGLIVEGSESQLNVIGVIAGCGPAFVYRFMETLVSESKKLGISDDLARKLVENTVLGAVSMVINSPNASLQSLREAVTSKGGTTFAGLTKMTEGHFEEIMHNTVTASIERTNEFEKMF